MVNKVRVNICLLYTSPVVRDEVIDLLLDFARDENHSILISSHIVSDLEKLCDTIAFLHRCV